MRGAREFRLGKMRLELAALCLVRLACLAFRRRVDDYCLRVSRGERALRSFLKCLLASELVDLRQDCAEGALNIRRVQRRRLDKAEVVGGGKGGALIGGDGAQVLEIRLVADEHDDEVSVGVVFELLQPPLDILKSALLRNVVYEQRADGAAVVRRRNGTVTLLTCRVPNLRLNSLAVNLDRPAADARRVKKTMSETWQKSSLEQGRATETYVANSTPIVDLDSRLNSFLVNRLSKFDFPTAASTHSTKETVRLSARTQGATNTSSHKQRTSNQDDLEQEVYENKKRALEVSLPSL